MRWICDVSTWGLYTASSGEMRSGRIATDSFAPLSRNTCKSHFNQDFYLAKSCREDTSSDAHFQTRSRLSPLSLAHSLSLSRTGWFWLRFAHFPALRPVLPGGPEALLHGGCWDRRRHLLEGKLSNDDLKFFLFRCQLLFKSQFVVQSVE